MSLLFTYTLTPRSRISAGTTGEVQNGRAAHRIIPGSVVRGALGTTWWTSPSDRFQVQSADEQERFDRLFTKLMTVGAAIPSSGDQRATLEAMSWVRCKYPTTDACLRTWADEAAGRHPTCPGCGRSALERGRGWKVPASWLSAATRTALAPDGAAEDEQLFTRTAMSASLTFTGQIRVDSDVVADLEDELAWLQQPMSMSIGGQRSTLGRVAWTCHLAEDEPAQLATGQPLVCRLRTPAILVDDYGAPTMDLAGALAAITARVGCTGAVTDQWSRPTVVSGWHGIAGLPKPEEHALEAGSTALLDGWNDAAISALATGVGLRRREGYGQVEILAVATAVAQARAAAERGDTSGPAVTGGPRSPGKAASARQGPVDVLLDLIPEELRTNTLNGLQSAARTIVRTTDQGLPPAVIDSRIHQALQQPWARDLGGDAIAQLGVILRSNELRQHLDQMILAAKRGQR